MEELLFFKVPKKSSSGQKFEELLNLGQSFHVAIRDFLDKYGFGAYVPNQVAWYGGVKAVGAPKEGVDLSLWRKVSDDLYYPKNKGKGKQIFQEMKSLPVLHPKSFNEVCGFPTDIGDGSAIGFSISKDFFLIQMLSKWRFETPKDFKKIKKEDFDKLLNIK